MRIRKLSYASFQYHYITAWLGLIDNLIAILSFGFLISELCWWYCEKYGETKGHQKAWQDKNRRRKLCTRKD